MSRGRPVEIPAPIVAAVILVAGVIVGAAVIIRGPGAVVFVPGVVGGLVVLLQPILGLLGVVSIVPLENLLTIGDWGTLTKALSAFVCGAWFLRKLARRESWSRLLSSPVLTMAVVFVAYSTASILWSVELDAVDPTLARMVMLMGLGVLTADLVKDWHHAEQLVRWLILGGLIAASLTAHQYYLGGVRRAGEGIGGGINATALLLLSILPLAFALVRASEERFWRMVALAYIPVSVLAIVVTFSRMTLMVLPLVLGFEYLRTLKRSERRGLVVGVSLLATLAVVPFLPMDRLTERVESIGPYVESIVEPTGGPVTEVSGRGYHIFVALAIFRDHPIVGAGFGNYGELFVQRYQYEVPGAGRLFGSSRSPHGNYWGFLADLGVVGIALWLAFLALAMRNFWQSKNLLADDRDGIPFNLTMALVVVFGIQILYGTYNDMHLSKLHWIVLGLSVAVRALAAQAAGGSPDGDWATWSADVGERDGEIPGTQSGEEPALYGSPGGRR